MSMTPGWNQMFLPQKREKELLKRLGSFPNYGEIRNREMDLYKMFHGNIGLINPLFREALQSDPASYKTPAVEDSIRESRRMLGETAGRAGKLFGSSARARMEGELTRQTALTREQARLGNLQMYFGMLSGHRGMLSDTVQTMTNLRSPMVDAVNAMINSRSVSNQGTVGMMNALASMKAAATGRAGGGGGGGMAGIGGAIGGIASMIGSMYSDGNLKSNATNLHFGSTYSSNQQTIQSIMGSLGQIFSSDERLKNQIQRLMKFAKINLYKFTWKDNGQSDIGFIAQEVEQYYPECVMVNKDTGFKMVNYTRLVTRLLKEASYAV